MAKRRLFINEQLDEEELYKLYYKYVMEHPEIIWRTGACYIRVSTNEQDKYSPRSQLKEIFDYAIDHNIYIPKEFIFMDIGKSGMKEIEKRSDFNKLINIAKERPFEILLLYKFARFARSKEDSVYYKGKLRKEYNIAVESIHEPLPNNNSRVMIESMYEGEAEMYVLNFRDEAIRGKREKATRGEWLNAPPYGYNFDRNLQIIVPNEYAKNVQYIFETFHNMVNRSIKKMVNHLNDIKMPSPKGGLWNDRTVHRILRNPAYIGYIRFCEGGFKRNYDNENIILFKGKHKAIISKDLFDLVQKDLDLVEKQHRKGMKPAAKHAHWLSCILKCDNCNHTLVRIATKSRKPWFQCAGYTKGICKISHSIREEIVVDLVLKQLKLDFKEKLDIKITKNQKNFNNEIQIIEKEITQINNKLKRVKLAYENEIDTLEEYKENKQRLTNKIIALEQKIIELQEEEKKQIDSDVVYKRCAKAYEILKDDKAPMELKKEIANNLFDKIVYDKQNEQLLIYYKA